MRNSILELAFSSDAEFYEKHIADAPLEEQAAFMKEFPDFLKEEQADDVDDDILYQKILSSCRN